MERLKRLGIMLRLVGFVGRLMFAYSTGMLRRKLALKFSSPPLPADGQVKNIVVVGASFAGCQAIRILHGSLPTGYRLVVVEPHSHFHFTWVFPRFCVIEGHEKKAFVPYAQRKEDESLRWIQGRALELTRDSVTVNLVGDNGETKTEVLRHKYLLLATGSVSKDKSTEEAGGLPSRIVEDDREEGAAKMRDMQARIQHSKRMVVVGGGAAGVELATDAADKYHIKDNPEKKIVLVHPRDMPMHRFGPRLQAAAMEGLKKQGVEVILHERVVGDIEDGMVTLKSGRKIECDLLVDCTGQRPASSLLSALAPNTVTSSGHVKVQDTLQVDDEKLSHIYACGDVADTHVERPNGRAATIQAWVAADNILSCVFGKKPTIRYSPHWADEHIKLTLGLSDSIMHLGDGATEVLFAKKDGLTLMAREAWWKMGAKPFEGIDASEPKPHASTMV